ncbi:Arginine biosynthesis bifunctional protein ArgJ (Includes: Glutamate N-acetyltransferase; Amino-acid acetyltransferase) [uncultured delta proteobacterium]|uniref:Arginine biosynthesis bifunctional protein ArgJ n=1 Tax=uncultured delta proteobacterium TaxID=34034 RepID=A0A212KB19_9DELT|nr:Arginine biosynthesis bifunctional protein ArgJ (Includes: Glutamate N-acetyltransferase; Amino-acid acetyltransferase) [uncultured delta proteobacterium]
MTTALPKGFRLATINAGFRQKERPDIALAVSDAPAVTAAMFTQAAFVAAPVIVAREMVRSSATMRAVLINTGQANACTGDEGIANCRETLRLTAKACGLDAAEILPASTGVIGAQMKMDLWEQAIPALAAKLGSDGVEEFANAIRTTDAFPKFSGAQVVTENGTITLAGMAKGAGMICPNMATMLCVVLCDAAVAPADWRRMFQDAVKKTFNRITVDGDTSTNDTIYGLANGASGVSPDERDLPLLQKALEEILGDLAYMLVQDGEGATKVLRIAVTGAASDEDAEKVARTVGHSQLVKTAMYGRDANWGRIVAAIGRSGAAFQAKDVRVSLCGVELFRNEQPVDVDFDALLEEPLQGRDIAIDISMGNGGGAYTLLASDLTHKYIDINADYRS